MLCLLISITTTFTNKKIYPTIVFPHFANNLKAKNNFIITNVFAKSSKKQVDLTILIKPFDKRFILFSQDILSHKYGTESFLLKLEEIYFKKYGIKDSFYVVKTPIILDTLF